MACPRVILRVVQQHMTRWGPRPDTCVTRPSHRAMGRNGSAATQSAHAPASAIDLPLHLAGRRLRNPCRMDASRRAEFGAKDDLERARPRDSCARTCPSPAGPVGTRHNACHGTASLLCGNPVCVYSAPARWCCAGCGVGATIDDIRMPRRAGSRGGGGGGDGSAAAAVPVDLTPLCNVTYEGTPVTHTGTVNTTPCRRRRCGPRRSETACDGRLTHTHTHRSSSHASIALTAQV